MEEKIKDIINPLIIINNDRYQGYKKAAEEVKDTQLKNLFVQLSGQSDSFGQELRKLIPISEQPGYNETTTSGKIYRVWMDVKAALAGNDRKAILESCEFGEDTALKTYDKVLKEQENIPHEALSIITRQRSELQAEHNNIKAMRDRIKEKVS